MAIALCATGTSTPAARALPPTTVPPAPDPYLAPESLQVDHPSGDRYTPLVVGLAATDDQCPGTDAQHPSSWHLLLLAEQLDVRTLHLDLAALERHDDADGIVRVVAVTTGDPLSDVRAGADGRIVLGEAVYLRPDPGLRVGRYRLALVCEQLGEQTRRWELALDLTSVTALSLEWQVAPATIPPGSVPTVPSTAVAGGGQPAPVTTADPATTTVAPAATTTDEPVLTVPTTTSPPPTTDAPVDTTTGATVDGDATADPKTSGSTPTEEIASGPPTGAPAPSSPVEQTRGIELPALPPTTVTIEDISASPDESTPTVPGSAQPFEAAVPDNALVVVQRCGVHGALPSEPADGGFPALAAVASREAPVTAARIERPGRCAARLGTAALLMSGPLAGQYYVAAGPIDRISIVDTRRLASGFSLSANVGSFRSDRDRFDGRLVGLTPVVSVEGPTLAEADLELIASEAISPGEGTGLADARMLAVAPAGMRVGTINLDGRLKVLVPVTAASGTYDATLTITAI